MTRFWRKLRRAEGGSTAMEFALVLPIVVGLLLFGVNSWLQLSQAQDMSTALHTGARYYQEGGTDDAEAREVALAAWPHTPDDATMSVARSCACGVTTVSCSSTCSGSAPPAVYITLTATSTFQGLNGETPLEQTETVRVR